MSIKHIIKNNKLALNQFSKNMTMINTLKELYHMYNSETLVIATPVAVE